jgi:integrase/recombinase XerC
MTNESRMPKYEAGDRSCPVCAASLAAHQTWPGARYRFCGAPECAAKVKTIQGGRYIGPKEHRCEGDNCSNFVPEGWYRMIPSYLSCSAACWFRRMAKGNIRMKCGCGCGQEFLRASKRRSISRLVFFSPQHQGDYVRNKYLTESCGAFREIVDEYLKGFAALHYRDQRHVREALGPFFLFLSERRIKSLEEVTPQIITQFLTWAEKCGRRSVVQRISTISKFFKWMIAEGRREAGNPVIGLIHGQRKRHRLPRPLEATELDFTWQLLRERGTTRLRFATAVAEEAGLRIGEICRLRISDVDPIQQRLFVRLPNKTNCERWALFSGKTKRYHTEWMAERNPNCGHDYLLHNTLGSPLKVGSLATEFRRTLCKTHLGKTRNETGFDKWSTHRLRHTMASTLVSNGADVATVMAAGGWKSYEAMAGYARVDADVARRGFDQAMRHAQNQKQSATRKKLLTPADLLERRQRRAVQTLPYEVTERCV